MTRSFAVKGDLPTRCRYGPPGVCRVARRGRGSVVGVVPTPFLYAEAIAVEVRPCSSAAYALVVVADELAELLAGRWARSGGEVLGRV